MARILVVDDERSMREFLEIFLVKRGHEVEAVGGGKEAVERAGSEEYDLVITDLRMPGVDGLQVLERVRGLWPDTQVIMVTAYSTTETAIEAIRKGAAEYLCKPFKLEEVGVIIDRALDKRDLILANQRLRREVSKQFSFERLVGDSPKMAEVVRSIRQVAVTKTNVLLCGESGTGKEVVAKAIHYNSPRADKPLVVVNCGAIPEALMESELFGHQRGSFTGAVAEKKGLFEAASGGTLFLDEIGELSLHLQVKLLRALQERKVKRVGGMKEIDVDVRLIAATNRDLEQEVRSGTFRDDLYFRINVVQINIPPLRERREDIPLLAHHFLERYNEEMGKRIRGYARDAMEALQGYDFPGNVRELENVVQRAVTFEPSEWVTKESFPSRVTGAKEAVGGELAALGKEGEFNLDDHLEGLERRLLSEAMAATRGSVTEAARRLGISFRSMRYKLLKYGMRKDSF